MDRSSEDNPAPGLVPLTKDMIAALRTEQERTGITVTGLVKHHLDPSLGISKHIVYQWMRARVRQARPEQYRHVLTRWKTLPDRQADYVRYSPDIRAAMEAERIRTGVSSCNLFPFDARSSEGLTRNRVKHFYWGNIKRLPREEFDLIMAGWKALPDNPDRRTASGSVPLTAEMIAAARSETARTGVGYRHLVKHHLDTALRDAAIHQRRQWERKSIDGEFYDALLNAWRCLPPKEVAYVYWSADLRVSMEAERNRTGVAACSLFAESGFPQGLTYNRVRDFSSGKIKRLPRAQVDLMMERWRALPTTEWIELTPTMLDTLRRYRARTGKGPQAMLRGAHDAPEGLTSTEVTRWLKGKVVKVRKDHVDYVLARYAAAGPAKGTPKRAQLRSTLRREMHRTRTRDDDLRRMLGIPEKQSWQLLPAGKLAEALDRLRRQPSRI